MENLSFEELLKLESLTGITPEDQIRILGLIFDLSSDNNSLNGIERGHKLASEVDFETLDTQLKVHFHYTLANGWGYKRKLMHEGTQESWNFQLPELSREIFHFRKAISITGFDEVQKVLKCQIYCNLGNLLSHIGRFVEAQEYWNRAILIDERHAMSLANKGHGLISYQVYLFDPSHHNLFIVYAYHHLRLGLKLRRYLHPDAAEFFQNDLEFLEPMIPKKFKNRLPNLNNYTLGKAGKLKQYRLWGIQNCLYINPLNDLGTYKVASHDCLNLPSIVYERDSPPVYHSLYNQMKQEFGIARFMYYESIQRNDPHYADKDIVIVETHELAKYSYHLEQLKSAFRMAYSILDKISYFLNHYLKLGIADHMVGFRTVWYENPKKDQTLRSFFRSSENWPLRGLYWLSKDLYEKDADFESVIEPEGQEIAKIRNAVEHKAFKIISEFFPYPSHLNKEKDIAYVIHRHEMEIKTLKLLTLTRAAMIYLSLAVNREESKKERDYSKTAEVELDTMPHGHKF